MELHRRPDPPGVGILPLNRPGAARTGIVLIQDPFHQRLVQWPDLLRVFIGAVDPHGELIMAANGPGDVHREALKIAFVPGQRLAVERHLGKVIDAVKHQRSHGVRRQAMQGKLMAIPQGALMIVSGAVPVCRYPQRAPVAVRSLRAGEGAVVGVMHPPLSGQ